MTKKADFKRGGVVETAAFVGLQDTPPGTAAVALAARAEVAPDALDDLAVVPSVRGAPLAVASRDLAVFTAGLSPPDEEAAKVVVGNAWKSLETLTAMAGPQGSPQQSLPTRAARPPSEPARPRVPARGSRRRITVKLSDRRITRHGQAPDADTDSDRRGSPIRRGSSVLRVPRARQTDPDPSH